MKKVTWKEKLQYWFDNLMSKGTIALVGMLFLITLIVVVITGIISTMIGTDATTGTNIWMSFMHALDAGTLAGDDPANVGYIITMVVVTLCGIFVTSILIGIITTGFEEKLNDLRKGNSVVIEKNHTVILGFTDNIYTIIEQLIEANESRKKPCIVILSEKSKDEMEECIHGQIEDRKNTRIICRCGSETELYMLEKCSIETSRSIIINETNDFLTIKTILATVSYLKKKNAMQNGMHIVATINDKMNFETAKIAGEGMVELVYSEDAIARIIAHTCRQPGMSNVLVELFDYDGDELYFEQYPELSGKTFREALCSFQKAILFGIERNGKVLLNPKPDMILEQQDQFIILEADDGVAKVQFHNDLIESSKEIHTKQNEIIEKETILVLGVNEMLNAILEELNSYVAHGTKVIIADHQVGSNYCTMADKLENIEIEIMECDINDRRNLNTLTAEKIEHILLLSDLKKEAGVSDAEILLRLIHLRDIIQKTNAKFSITSEMLNVANEKLAEVAKVNDLVVGTNIINLIVTQISENRHLSEIFADILDDEGSEIYMKKITNYIKTQEEVNFYTLTDIAAQRREVAIGYKKTNSSGFDIVMNPSKEEKVVFSDRDELIVLALE